jgi:hypothetical protein
MAWNFLAFYTDASPLGLMAQIALQLKKKPDHRSDH